MENERILEAAGAEIANINDAGEPVYSFQAKGQLVLTDKRLTYVKVAMVSLNVPDFTADLDGNLKANVGSFTIPLNDVEEASILEKKIVGRKFVFLKVKIKKKGAIYFFTRNYTSLCDTINNLVLSAKEQTELSQLETSEKPVESSITDPNEGLLVCPNCSKQFPITEKLCSSCGQALQPITLKSYQDMNGVEASLPDQVKQDNVTLNVQPSRPPILFSHRSAINCVLFILQNHQIRVATRIDLRGHNVVTILSDNFTLPTPLPKELSEAAKKWDETTVINWLSPHIPNGIAKAKVNPLSGIS